MGVSMFHNSFNQGYTKSLQDPDPAKFKILWLEQRGPYVFATIEYPNCVNYDGLKMLVFKTTKDELQKRILIDPHFDESDPTLIARVRPTNEGITEAVEAFEALKNKR